MWAIVRRRLPAREVWFLALPPALYLAVAMSAHMNIGMRHVLPMYAFLTVLEAGAAIALTRESRSWLYVARDSGRVAGRHLGQGVSGCIIPYANETVGRLVANVALAERLEL